MRGQKKILTHANTLATGTRIGLTHGGQILGHSLFGHTLDLWPLPFLAERLHSNVICQCYGCVSNRDGRSWLRQTFPLALANPDIFGDNGISTTSLEVVCVCVWASDGVRERYRDLGLGFAGDSTSTDFEVTMFTDSSWPAARSRLSHGSTRGALRRLNK